jgi:soluble lytic murein transglycosylase-like protein
LPLCFRRFLDNGICSRFWPRIVYHANCPPKRNHKKVGLFMNTLGQRFRAAMQLGSNPLRHWCLAMLFTLAASVGFAATTDPLPSDNPPTDSTSPTQTETEDPIVVDLDIPSGLAEFLDEKYPQRAQTQGTQAQGASTDGADDADQAAGADAPADPTQAPDLTDRATAQAAPPEAVPQAAPETGEESPNDASPVLANESAPASRAENAEAVASAVVQDTANSVAPAAASAAPENALEDPLAAMPYQDCFASAADRYQIDDALLMGIAIVESSMDPDAVSSANALGLMQIKWPITATHLGITDRRALFDPCTNIDAGARYLRELLDDLAAFSPEPRRRLALASYRLGPNGFDPNVPLPANAQDYIEKVTAQERLLTAPMQEAVATTAGPVLPCLVQNLRGLAITTHDPTQRSAQVGQWLDARGQGCSALALIQIRNNLPVWLGTALTAERATQVSDLLEQAINTTASLDTRTSRPRR